MNDLSLKVHSLARKKKNKKGFTLVEVIVVLVILAILAAILVPTMIGWINKSNEKTAIVEARMVAMAINGTIASDFDSYKNSENNGLTADQAKKVLTLAEVCTWDQQGKPSTSASITKSTLVGGQITTFTYTDSTGAFSVVYTANPTENQEKYAVSKIK